MPGSAINEAVRSAMALPEACAAVREIYCRLQQAIDQRKPLCVASGKCCHFEAFGHRLYITTLELATFKLDLAGQEFQRARLPIIQQGCPLQRGLLCGVHAIRPFGCRIFFCDPTAADWQQQQYELFHQQLKQLHDQFAVPYFYMEWRSALAACGI